MRISNKSLARQNLYLRGAEVTDEQRREFHEWDSSGKGTMSALWVNPIFQAKRQWDLTIAQWIESYHSIGEWGGGVLFVMDSREENIPDEMMFEAFGEERVRSWLSFAGLE